MTRINALMQTIMNTLNLLAPALGGVLLAAGFYTALFFDVGTAIIGVTVLAFIFVPKVEKAADESEGSIKDELKEGLLYAKNNDWLRFMLIFYAIGFFLVAPAAFLTPILVERVFGNDIWRLTANEIAWSGGAVIGGAIIAAWGGFKNRIFSMGFAFIFFGITFAAVGLLNNFWLYLVTMAIARFVFAYVHYRRDDIYPGENRAAKDGEGILSWSVSSYPRLCLWGCWFSAP